MKDEDKIGYETRELAEAEIRRIVETNYNTCKKVKPSRCYYSKITGLYHLTSKITITEYKK